MIHQDQKSSAAADHDYWQEPVKFSEIVTGDAPAMVGEVDYRLMADAIPALCWIARADGYIYWYNRRWYDYCGSTPNALEGWGWQSVHDPLELPKVIENWNRAIQQGEAFEMTFPLRGADGLFRQFLTRIVPVLGQNGDIVRWVGTNAEFESENSAKDALAVSEAKFRVLTDALPQMVWSTRPDGFHDYYNARWYEFTGTIPGSTNGDGWVDMFHADDREVAFARWNHSIATGDDYEIEYRIRHHSGEYRWTLGRALPVRDDSGQILRWIGTCTDIHESKLIAERTELMSKELSHRIKNIFAVVAGLIGLSSPKDVTTAKFAKQLAGRISALGRAHNFARPHSELSDPGRDFGTLHGLLDEILKPYQIEGRQRYDISGADIAVGERSATPIALVVHELATNAMKYGALATTDGRVHIETTVRDDEVVISWTEMGGPPVDSAPDSCGFGTQLSEIGITSQLGGQINRLWNTTGLKVVMTVPSGHL
ncbi:PAS domain-containing protein [Sphingorhabdus sp.]|uniref:PAS domain-containing protein n=1 Tax=Sphingorhabdus sp. TaxID=1902408 RepID=UPI003918D799